MFQTIRHQLLFSYLGVLTVILGTFAIAVRIVFVHSLEEQSTEEITTLAQAAATELSLEEGVLEIDTGEVLVSSDQGLQWFDTQGKLLTQQGNDVLTLPLNTKQLIQHQRSIKGITLPVYDTETKQFIGYVRASDSLNDLQETLSRLDWGLGGGIVLALVLSGFGGIWLTRQAMQPIERSFRRLQQFTADASHELRSPLMVITSNADVALKYPEEIPKTGVRKFRAIASASSQMTALTEDLLLLARADLAPNQKRERVNLTSLLEQLLQSYKPQAEVKQIRLKGKLAEKLYATGDSVQLARLLTNLLDNALRYTPEKGRVEIQAQREGNQIIINVQDTGIGIAPEQLEQVFDRFWRADQARSYNSGGSGLGLAIAQSIVQNHGGVITVSSQLNVGSCFTVRLPVA